MALALALALGAIPCGAAETLDIGAAWERLQDRSGALRGAALDARAKQLQRDALGSTDGVILSLDGFAARMSTTLSVDVSRITGPVNDMLGAVGLPGGAADIPPLPGRLSTTRTFNIASGTANAAYPLYLGGRGDAVRTIAQGRAQEAQAEARETGDQAAQTLVQRYFGMQLARRAAAVRAAAVRGIAEHQHQAERFEAKGLIAHHERLRADVALAQARSDDAKARSDAELSQLALDRLLDVDHVVPSTPLFVHSDGVGPLADYLARGRAHHPAWEKIDAKRMQAEGAHALSLASRRPQLLAYGSYTLDRSSDPLIRPDWAFGVVLHVPLVGAVDRGRLAEASSLEQQRVEVLAEQAARDVPTLVESQWRALENARAQYLATDAGIALARENVRLAQASVREGQGTVIDAIDARLALAKAQTEQAQLAYQYVTALSQLLAATGEPERFAVLAASADLRLTADPDLP
jgi:outer membrane protein TolC